MTTINKPAGLLDEHLTYLDDLRESGSTNMFGAGAYLREEFPNLTPTQARAILAYWMQTFSDQHTQEAS